MEIDEPIATITSPFFRLPGELRNRIYEYVLSAENGYVSYAWTTNSMGEEQFFCDSLPIWDLLFFRQRFMGTSIEFRAHPLFDHQGRRRHCLSHRERIVNICKGSDFPWVHRVIINSYRIHKIHEQLYTSQEDEDVQNFVRIAGRPVLPQPYVYPYWKAVVDFNTLKYVKKQMYAETAGLELKFNSVVFPTFQIDRLIRIDTCKLGWLKTVLVLGWCTCAFRDALPIVLH